MDCKRCGQENDDGARFCTACGAGLDKPAEGTGQDQGDGDGREGILRRVVGSSRRERVVTGATVAAVIIAIIAFLALDVAKDEEEPADPFTVAADARCVQAKAEISQAAQKALGKDRSGDFEEYARSLLDATLEWREDQRALQPPPERDATTRQLESALLDTTVALSELAAVARAGSPNEVQIAAQEADAATADLEAAIAAADLTECQRLTFSLRAEPASG